MTDQHPITPPPELAEKWRDAWIDAKLKHDGLIDFLAAQAAQWGADQELEACCKWLDERTIINGSTALRTARRPKPPSLKEQALIELGDVYNRDKIDDVTYDTIRKALEALDD